MILQKATSVNLPLRIIPVLILSLACAWLSLPNNTAINNISTDDFNLSFNPEGCELPCVWGITPGETRFTDALDIIESEEPDGQVGEQTMFWMLDEDDNEIYFEIKQNDPRLGFTVSQIRVWTPYEGQIATLGDFLNGGYTPVRTFMGKVNGPGGVSLLLVLDSNSLVIGLHDDPVSADSPIIELFSLDPETNEVLLADTISMGKYLEISWIGYAPADDYLNLTSPPE